ncbi:acyltransferase [Leptospira sp. 201903071]|uniref:acyltransferase n=1 Tax=Leptospira ainazelensis TaxID=2810034 RepID=UPI001964622A|nr:acyltransferase [Leptospira ainazelensis]MBM9502134.1 acyltransferase [Leptospira ainazelensis]
MKSSIKKILIRNSKKKNPFVFSILICFFFQFHFVSLYALDPLDPNLAYYPPSSPFVLNLLKIRFPEKTEVKTDGNGNHWKAIPTHGRAWMLILREWEGPFREESLITLLKELFPNSKEFSVPKLGGMTAVGAERKEIVSGNPLTIRYFLFRKQEKIVSVYLAFDSENKTISDFFDLPKNFLEPISKDSF